MADTIELGAVERLVGNAASKISMSSTKSSIGHLLGAAGAAEAIFSLLAIRDNIAPRHHQSRQSGARDGDRSGAHKPRQRQIDVALSNSFGFGGTNASLDLPALQWLTGARHARRDFCHIRLLVFARALGGESNRAAESRRHEHESWRMASSAGSASAAASIVPKTASEALRPEVGTPPPKPARARSRNQFVVFLNFMSSLGRAGGDLAGVAVYFGKRAFDGARSVATTDHQLLVKPNTGVSRNRRPAAAARPDQRRASSGLGVRAYGKSGS